MAIARAEQGQSTIPNPRLYDIGRSIVGTAARYMLGSAECTYESEEDLSRLLGGPVILCPKHSSALDIWALDALVVGAGKRLAEATKYVNFAAKDELWDTPLAGVMSALGAVPVHRGKSMSENRDMVDGMSRVLKNGGLAVIFPQGTTNDDDLIERKDVKAGPAYSASFLDDVPLVPVGGAGLIPSDLGRVQLHIGKFTWPNEFISPDSDNRLERIHAVRKIIDELHRNMQSAQDIAVQNRTRMVAESGRLKPTFGRVLSTRLLRAIR